LKLEDTIKGITTHRENIHTQSAWNDPLKLSETMLKLSTYNAYLADEIAPFHKIATDTSYKLFTEAISKGEPVTKAEQIARGLSTQERMDYENIKNIYSATSNLISVIQSRLKVIENARRQEPV
jgi:iron uptake system EfeUOB component EfeO/EfeM